MTVRCYTTLIWRCVCKVNVTCCDDVPKVFWVDPRAERDADRCMAIVSSSQEVRVCGNKHGTMTHMFWSHVVF